MDNFFTFLSYFLIANFGFFFGFIISYTLRNKRYYAGTIKVIPNKGKLIYSLELHEDPITLQDMNEVFFKIETSDESS